MDFDQLDQMLRDSVVDLKFDDDERETLRQVGEVLDSEKSAFLKNRAFAIARERMQAQQCDADTLLLLKWLEQVVKTLDKIDTSQRIKASAHFSPGEDCRRKLLELLRHARRTVEICVFTISDDRLSEAILSRHRSGVQVRIISDNDKQFDEGSDIIWLRKEGVPIRVDSSEYLMHHKFAIFDGRILVNGSFNWTASASRYNEENFLVTDNPALLRSYARIFETLWARYA